jgi:hypothetical protein
MSTGVRDSSEFNKWTIRLVIELCVENQFSFLAILSTIMTVLYINYQLVNLEYKQELFTQRQRPSRSINTQRTHGYRYIIINIIGPFIGPLHSLLFLRLPGIEDKSQIRRACEDNCALVSALIDHLNGQIQCHTTRGGLNGQHRYSGVSHRGG